MDRLGYTRLKVEELGQLLRGVMKTEIRYIDGFKNNEIETLDIEEVEIYNPLFVIKFKINNNVFHVYSIEYNDGVDFATARYAGVEIIR